MTSVKPKFMKPIPPKTPINGFIYYFRKLIKFYPNVQAAEVAKIAAQKWKHLERGERHRYVRLAREYNTRRRKALAALLPDS